MARCSKTLACAVMVWTLGSAPACSSTAADTADTGTALDTNAATDSPAESAPAETVPAETAPSEGGDAATGPDGCTLYEHYDRNGNPATGTKPSTQEYTSCLPAPDTATPSTYTMALLDQEIAHTALILPGAWGSVTATTCDGCACAIRPRGTDALFMWCWGGYLAGTSLAGGVGATEAAMCGTAKAIDPATGWGKRWY